MRSLKVVFHWLVYRCCKKASFFKKKKLIIKKNRIAYCQSVFFIYHMLIVEPDENYIILSFPTKIFECCIPLSERERFCVFVQRHVAQGSSCCQPVTASTKSIGLWVHLIDVFIKPEINKQTNKQNILDSVWVFSPQWNLFLSCD